MDHRTLTASIPLRQDFTLQLRNSDELIS